MNRFDRITAILIQLQSKKVVKAQDLADRFDISLRTVYRDIRSLEEAGVPLYGEAGVGYSLVDGYRLPPVMFTPEEAMAFITAGKLMETFTDKGLKDNFSSALFKVKAVLRNTEKDLVDALENQIDVLDHQKAIPPQTNALDTLLKATAEKKVVEMVYKAFGKDSENTRMVEPIGIFHENGYWYTIAWCHLRGEYRQFRLDRIISIKLTNIQQQEHVSLKEYRERYPKAWETYPVEKVVLRVLKSSVPYLTSRKHFYGFSSEIDNGDTIDMTFYTQWAEEGLLRWYLMFADRAEILEPEWLKDRAVTLLQRIIEKNNFDVTAQTEV
ncbi:helix-turn-helix transcriptional regulator [Flavobacterium sp. RHBU_3]|uniref:helix-turn-helix transcriptional regulator n=1 Tax=Flavobacterium sp. RHBU_3 TaxID=3391184 RepID=UPI0039852603